jgi:Lon protease-like protein
VKIPIKPLAPDSPSSERLFVQALGRLPMFPLPGVVLFPHAMLPLHIFEDRYRRMTRDVLESHRHLAVALLESPMEDPAVERPTVRPIMGVGEVVMAHELPDGRFNLVVRGRARVELQEELTTDEPYRMIVANVRADVAVTQPQELADADQSLRVLVGRLADSIPEGGELLRQVVASQATAAELADVLAAALIVDVPKRQRLLETRDLVRRIERVTAEVVTMTGRLGSTSPAN